MASKFLEAILPGLRDLRAPMVSGVLWAVFLAILYAEKIPDRSEATGLLEQIYRAAAVDSWITIVVGGILLFALGALTYSPSALLARITGDLTTRVEKRIRWAQYAQARLEELADNLASFNSQLAAFEADPANPDPTSDRRYAGMKNRCQEVEQRIETAKSAKGRWWIRETPEATAALGTPDLQAGAGLELQVVRAAQRAAMDAALSAAGVNAELEDASYWATDQDLELARQLVNDVTQNPLDAAQALDPDLYQVMDRDRAEHDVRIAMAVPAMAIGVYGAIQWTGWLGVVTATALMVFFQSARGRADEPSRVLRRIGDKSLRPAAVIQAEISGRDVVRGYLAKRGLEAQAAPRVP